MVFQQYSLFPWKTVRENVEFGLKMRGMPRSQRERAARTLLGLAGLMPSRTTIRNSSPAA